MNKLKKTDTLNLPFYVFLLKVTKSTPNLEFNQRETHPYKVIQQRVRITN